MGSSVYQSRKSRVSKKNQLRKQIKQLKGSVVEKQNWSNKKENTKSRKMANEKHANLDKGFIGHRAAKIMK